jgi:hypothetical protein
MHLTAPADPHAPKLVGFDMDKSGNYQYNDFDCGLFTCMNMKLVVNKLLKDRFHMFTPVFKPIYEQVEGRALIKSEIQAEALKINETYWKSFDSLVEHSHSCLDARY